MARRMEKSMTTLEQNKQTADGFGEKIKQIHQMLEEELLAGNNNQTWRTIRLAKYLLEDVQKERDELVADKARLELAIKQIRTT